MKFDRERGVETIGYHSSCTVTKVINSEKTYVEKIAESVAREIDREIEKRIFEDMIKSYDCEIEKITDNHICYVFKNNII